jgi:DNA-binding IclR family transcriptional regulator
MRARLPSDPEDLSANRTMKRGLAILRAFRPGFPVLTNGDLAERTGLPRSTVSRMTGALVDAGLLRQLPAAGGYAPTAACISLGFSALQSLDPVRQLVLPRMREAAEEYGVSVSVAMPDGEEMVYVDTFRQARREKLLQLEAGARLPMDLTALGRAALAVMEPAEREARIDALLARQERNAAALRQQIEVGMRQHAEQGWCQASWVTHTVAVARAVQLPAHGVLAFNCAGSVAQMTAGKIERRLVPLLLELTQRIEAAG